MSTNPAKGYGIANKGQIAPGYDGDLVLVDLQTYRTVEAKNLSSKCGWSPFEGWSLTGFPRFTIVGGQVVLDEGQLDTSIRGQALSFG
jgi:dihydroorotase